MKNSEINFGILTSTNYPLRDFVFSKLDAANLYPKIVVSKISGIKNTDQVIIKNRYSSLLSLPSKSLVWSPGIDFKVSHFNDVAIPDLMSENNISFVVNLGVGEKLTSKHLIELELGVISCHPGRLPDFKGSMCPEWALYAGQPIYNSIFRMDYEYDEGPVLREKEIKFSYPIKYEDFRTRIFVEGIDLLVQTISSLISDELTSKDFITRRGGNTFRPMNDDTFNELNRRYFTNDAR